MSISSTEGVTSPFAAAAAGTTGTTGTTGTSGTDDKQMFLELMVAQLRYQDPLNPTDSSEFLAQSAQFTALEKMQAVADQTAVLASTQLAFGASSLIGKTVRWTDAEGVEQTGTVGGTTFLPTGPMLSVDGQEVPLMSVTSVGDAPTITPDSSPDGSVNPPAGTPPTSTATARAAV